ncbi:MAG: response regulator [Bacteriovoracia bacterium]
MKHSVAGAKKRILVIDDEPELRAVIELILLRNQYAPVLAENATHAQALVRSGEIDMVLCDANMPDMSGFDFLRWLRKEYSLPFILMTGCSEAQRAALDNPSLNGVLPKPFVCRELLAQVVACLEAESRERVAA